MTDRSKTGSGQTADDDLPPATLDSFFDAARAQSPLPSGDLMARLEADALAVMPVHTGVEAPGILAQLREALGGWKGLGGLAAACAAGLWLGINPPASLDALWGATLASDTLSLDPLSSYDLAAFIEG